jgi:hypothetical protein
MEAWNFSETLLINYSNLYHHHCDNTKYKNQFVSLKVQLLNLPWRQRKSDPVNVSFKF